MPADMSQNQPTTPASPSRWKGVWLLAALLLLLLHGVLTLRVFGPSWGLQLLTAEPLVSGLYAQHLQQAEWGAQALHAQRGGIVFDPSFQAGYPKSPWFDAESPAFELFILCGGKHNSAESCKLGTALVWFLAPLAAALAGSLLGLCSGAATIALFLAMGLCWSPAGMERLQAGDLTTILASLVLLGWVSALVRLAVTTNPGLWLMAVIQLTALIWLQPLLLFIVLPAGLAYYSHVGWRRSLAWQAWFFSGLGIALAANLGRFRDALATVWLLTEHIPTTRLPASSVAWDWLSQLVRIEAAQVGFVALLLVTGFVGLALLRRAGLRGAARAWFVLLILLNVLALLGPMWSLIDRFEPMKLFFPGLLLATPPAGYAVYRAFASLKTTEAKARPARWLLLALPAVPAALLLGLGGQSLLRQWLDPLHLQVGPSAIQRATAQQLTAATTPTARILWEDTAETESWSPLLPKLTGRAFLGGLSRQPGLECFWLRLSDGELAGKSLHDWKPDAWRELCRRYNIGWVVVRSPQVRSSLQQLGGIRSEVPLPDGSRLLILDRPHSFVLKGHGRLEMNDGIVSLTDLIPDEGEVILSLHYVRDLHSTLSRVGVEAQPQKDDPMPLVRLKLYSPVGRVTLLGPE